MKTPIWIVKGVIPKSDYTLLLLFASGEKKTFDFKPLLNKKLYKDLNNLFLFMQAKNEFGTVIWNGDIDISPEYLYNNSLAYIETVEPDEFDLIMLNEIENNPECHEFLSSDELMKELGL